MKKENDEFVRVDFYIPRDLKELAQKIAKKRGLPLTTLLIQGLEIQVAGATTIVLPRENYEEELAS